MGAGDDGDRRRRRAAPSGARMIAIDIALNSVRLMLRSREAIFGSSSAR
jgi:hypothetical protein